ELASPRISGSSAGVRCESAISAILNFRSKSPERASPACISAFRITLGETCEFANACRPSSDLAVNERSRRLQPVPFRPKDAFGAADHQVAAFHQGPRQLVEHLFFRLVHEIDDDVAAEDEMLPHGVGIPQEIVDAKTHPVPDPLRDLP